MFKIRGFKTIEEYNADQITVPFDVLPRLNGGQVEQAMLKKWVKYYRDKDWPHAVVTKSDAIGRWFKLIIQKGGNNTNGVRINKEYSGPKMSVNAIRNNPEINVKGYTYYQVKKLLYRYPDMDPKELLSK